MILNKQIVKINDGWVRPSCSPSNSCLLSAVSCGCSQSWRIASGKTESADRSHQFTRGLKTSSVQVWIRRSAWIHNHLRMKNTWRTYFLIQIDLYCYFWGWGGFLCCLRRRECVEEHLFSLRSFQMNWNWKSLVYWILLFLFPLSLGVLGCWRLEMAGWGRQLNSRYFVSQYLWWVMRHVSIVRGNLRVRGFDD